VAHAAAETVFAMGEKGYGYMPLLICKVHEGKGR